MRLESFDFCDSARSRLRQTLEDFLQNSFAEIAT